MITHTSIEDIDVEVVYDYEEAEPDIGMGEVFLVTEINFKGVDIYQIIDPALIEMIESDLIERNI